MEESSDDNNSNYLCSLEDLVKKGLINQTTCDKVKLGSSIIEKKYLEKEKQYFKHEKLYNIINNYFNNITNLSDSEKEEIKNAFFQKINGYNRLSRQKISEKRFEIISDIGKGGFGKVKLCRDRNTNEIFAMKKLKFELLINKAQLFHINTEKYILSLNNDNPWKAKLNYSFLNNGYLYFIMDYYPGGDFLHYMNGKDTLTEEEAKFYIAEIILAVDSLHKNNCIHRDIKPENIFIDQNGHLKIGDFGLSILSSKITYPYTYKFPRKHINNNLNKLIGLSNVGSLLYVAPEVIEKKIYGQEIDWWSVGIILYEMLVGFPPFWNENNSTKEIAIKLKNFKANLNIPNGVKISNEAKKLIFDFLTEKEKRLGRNGIDEIKNHIFFKNFDWDNIRKMKPPYVPELFVYDKEKYNLKIRRKTSLQIYTSKENKNGNKNFFEIKQEKEKENKLNKMNLNYYDFDYNRELYELKYNIENNITELIKNEIDNYCSKKSNNKSINTNITIEETSTEEIASLKSNESSKKKNENLSKSYFNTEVKSKINSFLPFDKINFTKPAKPKFTKKNSIKIIPIRNLMNNINNTINRDKSLNKHKRKYSNIDFDHVRKDSNPIINDKNSTKSLEKLYKKTKTMYPKDKNIEMNVNKKKNCVAKINDNELKKMKIKGKVYMIKKNLGKYLLEQ